MSPTIRMVAADLDGTLLNDEKRIAPETVRAIHDLETRGIHFVIASARPPRSVRHIFNELRLKSLQINYNGALIWDEVKKAVEYHRPMGGQLALEMIRFARDLNPDVLVTCEILDKWHTDRLDNTYTTATGQLFTPDVIAPVEEFCCGEITKLLLLGPAKIMQGVRPKVEQRFGADVSLVCTEAELLQIMAKGVSKAAALQEVARRYNVQLSEVLAIGDGENDMEMLQECGMGVAVANASPALKGVADWITPSINSHGVLEAIRKYIPAAG